LTSGARLPAGWEQKWSRTHNRPYYSHEASGTRTWRQPG
jgi:hypothetical protein